MAKNYKCKECGHEVSQLAFFMILKKPWVQCKCKKSYVKSYEAINK